MAIHVIEHFYYWEALPIIKDWMRILKAGGKIVFECPNLMYACQVLIDNPKQASKADRNGQKSMWPIYGDPSWKDPLMCHKWGYTPESLKELLLDAGYTNVQQEKAQYKQKEPRDMRITGTRP